MTVLANDKILRWYSALYGAPYADPRWLALTNEEMLEDLESRDYVIVSKDDPLLRNQSQSTYMDVINESDYFIVIEEDDEGKILILAQ